jgi:hypothetical protein
MESIKKRSKPPIEYKEDLKLSWNREYMQGNEARVWKSQYSCVIIPKPRYYEVYLRGDLIATNILSLEAAKLIANVVINDYILHTKTDK